MSRIDQLKLAQSKAWKKFHKWNDVTGIFLKSTGYMAEIESVIDDAVRIGFIRGCEYQKFEGRK